jgi:hypothetical protein
MTKGARPFLRSLICPNEAAQWAAVSYQVPPQNIIKTKEMHCKETQCNAMQKYNLARYLIFALNCVVGLYSATSAIAWLAYWLGTWHKRDQPRFHAGPESHLDTSYVRLMT